MTLRSHRMVQVIQDITRTAYKNGILSQTTIDVIMTNCYSEFLESGILDDRIGDHQAIKCTLNFKIEPPSKFKKILIRDYSENNIMAFKDFLSNGSNYSAILNCKDVNMAAEGINKHINDYYDSFFPIKQIKYNQKYLYKPSKELLKAINSN